MYQYFSGHHMLVIGDSYAYGTGASDHLTGDTLRFSSLLASKLGATELNYAVGSTGFCDPGSGGQNSPFSVQIQNAINGLTSIIKNDVRLVLIAGGINDWAEGSTYSAAQMTAAAHECGVLACGGFPNAIILFVPMLFQGCNLDPRLLHFEQCIINGITNANDTLRCIYIQGAWTWNFSMASHYASDKLHPNDLGHRVIANNIYANLFGGLAFENRMYSPSWETGYSSTVAGGGYFELMNGIIMGYGMQVSHTTTIAANTNTLIGSVAQIAPLMNVAGVLVTGNTFHGIWQITTSGNIYVKPDAQLNPGDMYLAPVSYIPKGLY